MERAGQSGWSGATHRWLSTATSCWPRCTRGRTPTRARPRSTCAPGRTGTQATSSPVGPDLGGIAAVTDGEPRPPPVLNSRAIRVLPYEWPAQVFPYLASCCYHTGGAALAELSATQARPFGGGKPSFSPVYWSTEIVRHSGTVHPGALTLVSTLAPSRCYVRCIGRDFDHQSSMIEVCELII